MARENGNGVTIGSSVNNNYLYINWSTSDEPQNNRTYVSWNAGFHYTSSDAQLDDIDISINGLRYDNPGRVKNYAGTFTTRDHDITGGQGFYIDHDSNGNATITLSGSIGGSLSARSTISPRTYGLTNYDRSPTTPSISSITRSADGASITAFNYSGGVNNSGPAVTYTFEYSTTSSFSTIAGSSTTIPFNLPSPTTSYYFRVKANNTDGEKISTPSGIYYGVPSAPTFASGQGASTSSSIANAVSISWTAPTNTQTSNGTAGLTYDVYRGGTKITSSPISATSYTDTGLDRGASYSYYIVAINNVGSNNSTLHSRSATTSATASGVPAAPTGAVSINKVGRNVTVSCQESPTGYNNIIAGYKVQYSTDNGDTWSAPQSMTSRSYQYILLPPALTYIFRCYAINIIGNGDTLSSTPVFVSAGGRRKLPAGDFEPTQTAKRYDSTRPEGQRWVDLNTAKRYSSAANNGAGGWIDLS